MKKEDFFEILGELDDDMVKGAKTTPKKKWKKWKNRNQKIWGIMAACLCLAIIASFIVPNALTPTSENDRQTDAGKEDSPLDGNPNGYDQTADIAPMVCVNRTLYQIAGNQPDMTGKEAEFLYLGKIISKVEESQKPTEDFQANDDIIGSRIYQYGEDIVIEIDGQYWLYEMLYEFLDSHSKRFKIFTHLTTKKLKIFL